MREIESHMMVRRKRLGRMQEQFTLGDESVAGTTISLGSSVYQIYALDCPTSLLAATDHCAVVPENLTQPLSFS